MNLSSVFAFVGHAALRASPSEEMQRSLQLPLEPLVTLNVRFIFMFILLSIFIFIFIEVSGNLQCQNDLECPSMLFQVFNKYIIRYGLLILGLQAFIVYKCVTRFLTYISLPWPQVTMMTLHVISMFAISKEWRGHNKNKLLRNNNHILS